MANNDSGSLSYSLNIDTSQISKEIKNVEKQLSTIRMIADMSVNSDAEQIIKAIKNALMAEDFKLKVTLDDSFNKTINQAFSIADSAANGALEGALSAGLKGGIAGFAVNGVMALVGAYIDYSNEQERIQMETAQTIEGINLQQQNVNGLFNQLTNLTNSTADSNTITSERIRLLNELASIEPVLAESLRQQADDQNILNTAMQQYNTLAEFKGFSLFLANENKGLFSDNLMETLNELGEVESKLKIAEYKVQKTYNKAYEVFKGGGNGKYAKDLEGLSENTLQQINQIFTAKESEAKKLEELSGILNRSTQGLAGVSFAESSTQKNLINIIGGSLKDDSLKDFKGISYDFSEERKEAEQAILEFTDNIKAHMAVKGLDMKQNEDGIRNYIKTWGGLSEYAQKEILLNLGIKWDNPVQKLEQWQTEIQGILGNSISINVNSTMPQVITDIRSKYAVLKQSMESLEPIYIKAKYNLENNIPLDPITKSGYEQYTANQNVANRYIAAGNALQFDLNPPKTTTPKATEPQKDKILETYKKQIELIKKLSTVYKQNKEIWSDNVALDKTFESYKDQLEVLKLSRKDLDIKNPSGFYKDIQSKVAGNKARKEAIDPMVLDDLLNIEQEGQKEEWSNLNKEIEKTKKAYELYDSLRKKIGDDKAKEFVKSDTGVEISENSFSDYFNGMIAANKTMSEKMSNDLKDKYAAKAKETLTSLLQDFQTAEDKLNGINTKYDKYKADLDANKANMDPTRYEATNKLINEGRQKEISGLSDGLLEKTNTYKSLFEEATKASEKEITFLIEKFKTAIAEAKDSLKKVNEGGDGLLHLNIDGKEIIRTQEQVEDFVKKLEKEEKKVLEKNPFKALRKSFKDLSENLKSSKDIKNKIKTLEDSLETAPDEETGGINTEIDLLKEKLKGVDAQNATTWANMATQISNATKQATDLGNSFVSLYSAFAPEDTDTAGTMTDIIGIVGGVGEAGAGIARIASGDVIGGLTQGIKGVASVVSSITSLGDRKHEKEIRRLQKAIDESKIAYEDLGRTATKAFGDASYNARKLQIAQLKLQQTLIQKQIQEEKDKKKTDKDKVKQLEEQYRQLGIQIEDGLGSILENMLGGNIKSFAGQLSDALLDAFVKGEDAAEGYRSKVKDVIGDIMRSVIKQRLIEDVLGKTMDKYVNKWVDTEGNLTKTPEDMLKDMVLMGTELEAKGDTLAKMLENLPDDVKKYFQKEAESQQLSGLSKGVQGMTQDTAMILEAYMNTIRDVVISIMMSNENQLSVLQSSQMIQSQILTQVSAINSNTVALNRAFQSVITQSGGDNGAGIRVYVK